ncbi:methyltransferase domain-containing protein [Craurococcus roseus]|uniref:Methyltransferase domain-containing protein n=1 Tax=Craurococcus roseus TaxID=77585 RepID=A0ABP3QUA8_9PROT
MAEGPDGEGPNAAQIAYWNSQSCAGWLTEHERLDALFAPLTEAALAAAAPYPGERAADVGCGAGATVLALARAVGPGGGVLGLDVSERLVARARERIAEAGLDATARVELADAALRPFAAEADLLFSRFGVMFFADPVAAFANLRRALRPEGRMAFVAWRPLAENPWFRLPVEAAREHLPPSTDPPPEPCAPGPFAFDDLERVRGILAAAGWRGVEIAPHDPMMRLAPAAGAVAAARDAAAVGPLARALAGAGEEERRRAVDAVAEALRAHDGPGGVVLPGAVWLVSARP